MSDKSGIAWTDATWNPTTGCTKVSPGCKNCYAKHQAWPRLAAMKTGVYSGRKFEDVQVHPERLDQPLRWKKPRMIFVNSMSDLFHEDIPTYFIQDIFATMAASQHHIFQVLTKRPELMLAAFKTYLTEDLMQRDYFANPDAMPSWPLPNVWLGVSVENQATADERIPPLLQTPAAVRWISAEPLLDELELSRFMWPVHAHWPSRYASPEAALAASATVEYKRQALVSAHCRFLDWVVVGGESGPKARPMNWAWADKIHTQCCLAGVWFFMKQGSQNNNPHFKDFDHFPESLQVREYP